MNWIAQKCILAFGWRRALMMLGAGALAGLSMPPVFLLPALFVAMPLWVWALDGAEIQTGWRRVFGSAFQIGFFFALGYFLVALHWIGAAFFVDGGWLIAAMPLAVLALGALMAIFWGLASALAHLFWSPSKTRVLALGASLSGAEFVRGHVFSGFPFDLLGYALSGNEMLMQTASLVGVYGLTFIASMLGFVPALIWPADGRRLGARLVPFFAALLIIAAMLAYGNYRLRVTEPTPRPDVRLRLVQPGIKQSVKWRPGSRDFILNRLFSLSQAQTGPGNEGLSGVTYLIWPEAALPFFLADFPEVLTRISDMLPTGTVLLTGAPRRGVSTNGEPADYNALLAINSNGEVVSSYDKTHLVPIGEYLPFKSVLEQFGLRQFVPGLDGWSAGEQRKIMRPGGGPGFLPLICYEAIFSGDLGDQISEAKFILNITNDAWFDGSIGPLQHFYHARLRALEHGIPLVRVANSGVSALVDPLGRITSYLAPGEVGLVDLTLPNPVAPTLFSKWTNWPFLFALLLSFMAVLPRYFHFMRR